MTVVPPFGTEGIWLRCALHAHTTESDGMLTPPMLRRYYTMGGFDVLAITDHDRLTELPPEDPQYPGLLLLQGTEISLRAPVSGGPLHLLGIGVREMPQVHRQMALAEAVARVRAAGGVPIVAHPWWSGLQPEELGDLAGAAAIEVYNAGCEVEQSRGNSALYWDVMLAKGVRVNAIATDDHHMPGFDAFQGWTMVRAAERTPEAILAALEAGRFYSTTGPAIQTINVTDTGLFVECSPAASIAVVAQPPYGARVGAGPHGLPHRGETDVTPSGWRQGTVEGELLTHARFPRFPGVRYLRVEVTDPAGRKAWSNPIWFD